MRLRPTAGYCGGICRSDEVVVAGAGGVALFPLAITGVGAVRSWLFLLELGLDDVLLCCEFSETCSGRPSLELRREEEGLAEFEFELSKSRRLTFANAAVFEVGGVSCEVYVLEPDR